MRAIFKNTHKKWQIQTYTPEFGSGSWKWGVNILTRTEWDKTQLEKAKAKEGLNLPVPWSAGTQRGIRTKWNQREEPYQNSLCLVSRCALALFLSCCRPAFLRGGKTWPLSVHTSQSVHHWTLIGPVKSACCHSRVL